SLRAALDNGFDPRGVAAFPDGRVLVAGTDLELGRARTFTLDPSVGFAPVASWTAGTSNNEARAVALAKDGSLVIAGVEHMDWHDDAIVWSFPADALPAILRWEGPMPFALLNEVANAVYIDEERILVAGSAVLFNDLFDQSPRAFVLEYARSHTLARWWAHADGPLQQSSVGAGVAAASHGGAVIVGHMQLQPNTPRYLQIVELAPTADAFEAVAHLLEGQPGFAGGVARDPSARAVVVWTNTEHNPTTLDAVALNLEQAKVSWQAGYEHTQSELVEAAAVAVDPYGFVYFLGTVTYDGGIQVVVGKRRP
ncbi:MAG: hypothetical protein KC636_15450, partial [Myxococcales bacterium]|nr:hypothetical protein [Myxococcales bacterium]